MTWISSILAIIKEFTTWLLSPERRRANQVSDLGEAEQQCGDLLDKAAAGDDKAAEELRSLTR